MKITGEQIDRLSEAFSDVKLEDLRRPLKPDRTIGPAMRAAGRRVRDKFTTGAADPALIQLDKDLAQIFPELDGIDIWDKVAQIFTAEWPDDSPATATPDHPADDGDVEQLGT
ncbi:MAG TPA: hypothetical protein VJG48_00485 [Candidatus Paceibacterota bacterium]